MAKAGTDHNHIMYVPYINGQLLRHCPKAKDILDRNAELCELGMNKGLMPWTDIGREFAKWLDAAACVEEPEPVDSEVQLALTAA